MHNLLIIQANSIRNIKKINKKIIKKLKIKQEFPSIHILAIVTFPWIAIQIKMF